MALQVTYCELWSNKLRSPTDVPTEAETRDRDARGEQYCVVLGDPAAPQAILEIAWVNPALSETAQFRPDGYASRTIDDSSAGQIEKMEYTDVPVEANWEPMPEFGHWESVARYDRDAPPNL